MWKIYTLLPDFIKSNIRDFVKKIISNKSVVKTDKQIELARIKSIPRYSSGITTLFPQDFKFVDSASFLFIYDEIFNKNIYAFRSNKEEPFIIDCGANIGLSILYFKKIFPGAQILAFEPDPIVCKVLNYNISNLSNVQVIDKALWNEETVLNFHTEGADGGSLSAIPNEISTIGVRTDRLSKHIIKEVDFLKIDIEGAELKVLEDCEESLHLVQNMFIEYHSFVNLNQELASLISILERNNFRYHITSPGLSSPQPFIEISTYNGMDMQLNIYAYKK